MRQPAKKTISAQIPVELAAAVESLAIELDRSKSWVIKEALTAMIEAREQRHQAIQKGLVDVEEGRVVRHSDMLNIIDKLK
ncbi:MULTISPECIES: ribbon-helix-helix domain-containing protein [unclassified Brenneria]|uniref:CopG family ribbon-helix-helix protein n=1 Tax=unclassified Brenneria TaxID=2634434 RepID=UPI0029C5324D|nr:MULTISPECIES: ribbon-helix-helix domain-containing protein [unclassified Brenneria]MDX5629549.1 ribbon-helix-helix domain-containing protein [Brenneria sp. L3-3Z]MDX5696688.1 ribbon-helix-helix domain-containing protein [Brenneria sp. L4-2C]